jgi:hypothetical protein
MPILSLHRPPIARKKSARLSEVLLRPFALPAECGQAIAHSDKLASRCAEQFRGDYRGSSRMWAWHNEVHPVPHEQAVVDDGEGISCAVDDDRPTTLHLYRGTRSADLGVDARAITADRAFHISRGLVTLNSWPRNRFTTLPRVSLHGGVSSGL